MTLNPVSFRKMIINFLVLRIFKTIKYQKIIKVKKIIGKMIIMKQFIIINYRFKLKVSNFSISHSKTIIDEIFVIPF